MKSPPPSAEPTTPDENWRRSFGQRLLRWFDRHARDLPWRRTRDPYAIWISEIMLQQTQVATVVPYFQRFLARFPDIHALAAADEQEVLQHWEGLGYYRRARQLHRAAQEIVEQHKGVFPSNYADVFRLPGIGRYTAGAILSIAFDQKLPILEANTIRLHARLLALKQDPTLTTSQKLLWDFATKILPTQHAGRFNQGLMELGSAVCTPKQPKCDACPVSNLCLTARVGLQHVIPATKQKAAAIERQEVAVVICRHNQILIRQCQPGERWAGLWDFPRFESDPETLYTETIRNWTGLEVVPRNRLTTIRHGVTRFRITLTCEVAEYRKGELVDAPPVHPAISTRTPDDPSTATLWRWVSPDELENYPLSTTGRKIAQLIQKQRERGALAADNSPPPKVPKKGY